MMVYRLWTCLVVLLCSSWVAAEELAIPEPLQAWQQWAMHGLDDYGCPFFHDQARYSCLWVSASQLNARASGVSFSMSVESYGERWLDLPGTDTLWPQQVFRMVNGIKTAAPVRVTNGRPQVRTVDGDSIVSGFIAWPSIPQSLQLPVNSGLIELTLEGKRVSYPEVDESGVLWLKREKLGLSTEVTSSANMQVFRLIHDTNPVQVTTRVVLDVSGQAREITAGQFLLDNFVPIHLDSPLPARIDDQKLLRVQVKPGRWQIDLTARLKGPLGSLSFEKLSELWPTTEIWAFQSDRRLRTVRVEGTSSIDPNQTNLPAQWRSFPAYRMHAGEPLSFKETHRGDPTPEADNIAVNRTLYLDFDGAGFTVADALSGQLKRSWRLDSSEDFHLGSAKLNGEPQLITQTLNGKSQGLEIRDENLDLFATGRVDGVGRIHVSGWQTAVDSMSATLHLAPGWSLLASTGVDRVNHSWVSRWSLWHIFLFLIIAVAIYRLCGPVVAAVAALTLLLIFHRSGAPVALWLWVVVAMALINVTEGKLQRALHYTLALSFVVLLLVLLPFSISQVRQAIYPQLKYPSIDIRESYMDAKAAPAVAAPMQSGLEEAAPDTMMDLQSSEHEAREHDRARKTLSSLPSKVPQQQDYFSSAKTDYDPNAIVQTGPGVPRWRWDSVRLTWSGPIAADETMRFILIPPWLNRIGALLSVIFCFVLLGLLLQKSRVLSQFSLPRVSSAAAGAILLPFLLIFGAPQQAQASVVIDEALLKELRERLAAPSACLPSCASIQQAGIAVEDNQLRVTMVVDTLETIAMPLPASRRTWLPQQVMLDGQRATLKVAEDLQLLAKLPAGRHTLVLSGPINADQVELRFNMPVHNVSITASDWDMTGSRDGFAKTGTLQLQRLAQSTESQDTLLPDPIPPYVEVTRILNLGLEWQVETVIRRIAPRQGAMTVKVPLLPGESPTSELAAVDGLATIVFGAQQNTVTWRSLLSKSEAIDLTAPEQYFWSETWVLNASPIWHVAYQGIPPIKQSHNIHRPVWMPWPGESLTVNVSRPLAEPGQSLTIDNLVVTHDLGQRLNETVVTMNLRTSRGQNFPFTLPAGAVLDSVIISGETQPLSQTEGQVDIPLRPGEQSVQLSWHNDAGVSLLAHMPEIDLNHPASNVHLQLNLPRDRWPLLVGGPSMGPAVLLWGVLLVAFVAAYFLGRSRLTPLRFHHWALLAVGVASTNIIAPIIIVVWLFALGLRGALPPPKKLDHFRFMQVCLIILSALALFALLATIPMGLLSQPDMHIVGNGSSAYHLRWYQDLISQQPPTAWVLSLPMFVYRMAMLLWSLWLAIALLQWLKWGWQQMNKEGFWQTEKAQGK